MSTIEMHIFSKDAFFAAHEVLTGDDIYIVKNEKKEIIGIVHHIDFDKSNNILENYLWITSANHLTNFEIKCQDKPTQQQLNEWKAKQQLKYFEKREYIAKGKLASLAFENCRAPYFWSNEAKMLFYWAQENFDHSFPPGDTVLIQDYSSGQGNMNNFL